MDAIETYFVSSHTLSLLSTCVRPNLPWCLPKGKQREGKGLTVSVEGTSGVQARSECFQLLVFLGQHSFVNLHCVSLHIILYF